MSMFSKAEADRIAAVVSEVEQRTAGEIVVAEVPSSDEYAEVRLFCTLMVGLLAGAGAHLAWPALPVGAVLAIQFGAGLLAWLATGARALLRLVLPRRRAQLAVGRAAELAFLEHGVFSTRDRTGVLIFLSELEHRVVILGDKGIHERLQNPGWSALVSSLVQAIKQRRATEGVCEVITKLGETLARDAPVLPDDTNELPNYVRGPSTRA
jgi:putative membrane protein